VKHTIIASYFKYQKRKTHEQTGDDVCQGWPNGGTLNLPVKMLIMHFTWAQFESEGLFKGFS
jgi:hypothetical protein